MKNIFNQSNDMTALKYAVYFFTSILIMACAAVPVFAQTETPSIGQFLDGDGHIKNPDNYIGSLDISGFKLTNDVNGTPVFRPASGLPTSNADWHPLGDGVSHEVSALAISGENLFVGGFFSLAGGQPASRIARYNLTDGTWHPIGDGVNSGVMALAVSGDDLFVGGDFTEAGGQPASRIARYNLTDGTWHALGLGVNDWVEDFAISGNNLFVGGWFTEADGQPISFIARYDMQNNTWHDLGNGVNSSVNALAIAWGNLFVGGWFTQADGQPANHIARYDLQINTWYALGDGVDNDVKAIAAVGTNLFVGGNFQEAGGQPANFIARFDLQNGTWHALDGGVAGTVSDITFSGDDLYVGGYFTQAGNKGPTGRIARYDMTLETWHFLGDGLDGPAFALAVSGAHLFVGGFYTHAGGQPASNIARWSGATIHTDWYLPITAQDMNYNFREVAIGTAPSATNGFDIGLDQYAPPPPPDGSFDIRIIEGEETYLKLYKPSTLMETIWTLEAYPETPGGFQVSLEWDMETVNDIPGYLFLYYEDSENVLHTTDMKADGLVWLPQDVHEFTIRHTVQTVLSLDYQEGWNLIGSPLGKLDISPYNIFNNAMVDSFFGYNGAYTDESVFQYGAGYWLRLSADEQVEFYPVFLDSVSIDEMEPRWHLIAGLGQPVDFANIIDPEGILVDGTLMGYDNDSGYFLTDTIEPGRGYWVRTDGFGSISMVADYSRPVHPNHAPAPEGFARFSVSNNGRELDFYLGGTLDGQDINPLSFSMPPKPPTAAFDIRFDNNRRMIELESGKLVVQSPVETLTFNYAGKDGQPELNLKMVLIRQGETVPEEIILKPGEQMDVYGTGLTEVLVELTLATSSGTDPELPLRVSLSQNYPNPFNPTTQIKYALPEAVDVRLDVYNIAGQRVATLVNAQQNAGHHTATFDGSRLASGVYVYRLQAGNVVHTRKMVLVK